MSWPEIINLVASIATAIGVIVAAIGLWLTKIRAVTAFEDGVSNELKPFSSASTTKQLIRTILQTSRAINRNMLDFSTSL